MVALIGLPIAALVLFGLSRLARGGVTRAWIASAALSLVIVGAAIIFDRPSETSNVALAVGATLALWLATAVILHGARGIGRSAAFIIATLIFAFGWIPGYMVGCMVADWLPVNRCFF